MTQPIKTTDFILIHVLGQLYRKPLQIPEQFVPPSWQDVTATGCLDWSSSSWAENFKSLIHHHGKSWFKDLYQTYTKRRRTLYSDQNIGEITREHLYRLNQVDAKMVFIGHKNYPKPLEYICSPPTALSVWGNATFNQKPHVAVVGSRKTSPLSSEMSFAVGRKIAQSGWTCVSGGAYGCDIAAHQGVLSTHISPTPIAAVFAGGLGYLSPSGNQPTFRAILEQHGCLISEKLWQHKPTKYDFPLRNRILVGICSEVILIQAGTRSGTSVTANLALEEGRELIVYEPPPGCTETFAGNHKFLQEGATSFKDLQRFKSCHLWDANHQNWKELSHSPIHPFSS